MYFGNNDGILMYDGVHWRTFPVANRSQVRSLAVDSKGTVYAGAGGEFGYLAIDTIGNLRYVSLLDRVPLEDRAFKNVWKTLVTPEGVFFSSQERLFRWSRSELKVWKPEGRFDRAFLAGNTIYVQQYGGELLRVDRDQLIKIPGTWRFTNERIFCVLSPEDKSLFVASPAGIFRQDGDTFTEFPTEADPLLRESSPISCNTFPGGSFGVSTRRSGVIIVNAEGRIVRVLNKADGFQDEAATFAYPDREGGLWVTLASGVTRVEMPGPLSYFDERNGLKGSVLDITRHDGSLYAAASTGFYRLQPSVEGRAASFEKIEGSQELSWALLSTGNGLLVGGADGIYLLEGNRTRLIQTSKPVYDLTRSRRDPALVYAAGVDGLVQLRWKDGHWTDARKVTGIKQILKKPVEDGEGRVWIGTEYEGALRVSLQSDPPTVEVFGAQNGLPSGWIFPYWIAGHTVFATERGILQFDESSRRFSQDPILGVKFAKGAEQPSVLSEDLLGNIWASARTYGGLLRRNASGGYVWDPLPFRRMDEAEIYSFHLDDDGVVWAGAAVGMVRYSPEIPKDYAVPFQALIRRVNSIDGKTLHFGGYGQPSRILTLPYSANGLRFEFTAPAFDDETRTEYKVFLDGFDGSWSDWSSETHKDYTNLPERNYVFRVLARNLYGVASTEGRYAFTMLPPWYRTWWAHGLQVLGIAGVVTVLVWWQLRRLATQNKKLQQTVEQRTQEIRRQSDELRNKNSELTETNDALAEANESLNNLNAEKNDFLGIVAHDLKNPLGAIRGFAEMLEEDADGISKEEVTDYAGRIKKGANLMFDLVSNLLDINRIEQGQLTAELKPCDLSDTARQAVEGYEQRAAAKAVRLHFDESHPPPVMGDPAQLVQVVDNLLSNAVKYSPREKNIFVRVLLEGSAVRLEIQDEGPGISYEDQKRLFGKFARLTARPTAGEHSTGLGLAIVKRLAEAMGGRVWCESELGHGATFVFEMPVANVRAEALR